MALAAAEPGGFHMGVKWLLESEFIVMLVPKDKPYYDDS
jgi:hypothetical protein